jgi:hypothetical protein
MKTRFLIIIAVFVVLIPWIKGLEFDMNDQVMADGITVSAITVMTITVVFSIMSWFLFSWASRNIKFVGIPLSVIAGTSLVIPFLQVLGPMAGVVVGVVAGFASFMIQKKITDSTQNTPLVIAVIIIVTTYFVLTLMILAVQTPTHVWDTGDGIRAWVGTADRMEPRLEIGDGAIDLDPDLSPSYALDFPFGWKSIFVFVPMVSGIIAAVLLGIHFILKKKKIRSRPYITIISAAIMLYFGIQTLSMLGTIVMFLQQESPWHYLDQAVTLLAYPIMGFSLVGLGIIFLYKSQLVRRLIQK